MSSENFVFDPKAPRFQVRKAQMLQGLADFAKASQGRNLSMNAFDAWPQRPCSAYCIFRRFGGWLTALRAAGIRAPNDFSTHTPQELMDILERTWLTLERPPGRPTLRKHGGITELPYRRLWGSIQNACNRLALFKAGSITQEELLQPTTKPRAKPPAPRARRQRKTLGPKLRFTIMQRDGGKCTMCGATAKDGAKLEVDHIHPVSAGGGNDPANLTTLCQRCNVGKGGQRRAA
jgi:hypothetical protein